MLKINLFHINKIALREVVMEIKQILASEINSNLLDNFNFYNKVTKVWRKKENDWVLEDISYIRNWDNSKKR